MQIPHPMSFQLATWVHFREPSQGFGSICSMGFAEVLCGFCSFRSLRDSDLHHKLILTYHKLLVPHFLSHVIGLADLLLTTPIVVMFFLLAAKHLCQLELSLPGQHLTTAELTITTAESWKPSLAGPLLTVGQAFNQHPAEQYSSCQQA